MELVVYLLVRNIMSMLHRMRVLMLMLMLYWLLLRRRIGDRYEIVLMVSRLRLLRLLKLRVAPGIVTIVHVHGVHSLGILTLTIGPRAMAMWRRAAICHNFIALRIRLSQPSPYSLIDQGQ